MYAEVPRFYTDIELYYCANWPKRWPLWIGGNADFINQGQPFNKMIELIHATSLEF